MGRSAAVVTELQNDAIEMASLDDDIASILVAIEAETVPQHLTSLAVKLQEALLERKRRNVPN